MESSKLEDFKNEVDGYATAFFHRVTSCYDIILNDKDKEGILDDATHSLGQHMTHYKVCAKTIDGFKLVAFLGYFTAINIEDRVSFDKEESILAACSACVSKLDGLLQDEAADMQGCDFKLEETERKYLSQMLYSEVIDKSEIGVGPNGMGAVFSFMRKSLNRFSGVSHEVKIDAA